MTRIDELEADARAARDSAEANAEAIAQALDPANWFRPVRDAGRDVARTVERLTREHPAALGAAALGLVALFAAARPRTRSAIGAWRPVQALGKAGTGARHAGADVAHAARMAAARAGVVAHATRERAEDAAHVAGSYAQDLAKSAAQRAEAAVRAAQHGASTLTARAQRGAAWASHEVQEHPGAALIAAGLAAGAALAVLMGGRDQD